MSSELLARYKQAAALHSEKFDEPPYFLGMFMPAVDGEEYIELIDKAIKSNRPVNELKDAPAHLQDKTINW